MIHRQANNLNQGRAEDDVYLSLSGSEAFSGYPRASLKSPHMSVNKSKKVMQVPPNPDASNAASMVPRLCHLMNALHHRFQSKENAISTK